MKPLMQRPLYRVIRTLHAWGGAVLALLLLLSSLTGTVLLWKQEIVLLGAPGAAAAFDPSPQGLARVAQAVERRYEPNDVAQILFPTEDFPLAKVVLADTRYAYLDGAGRVIDEWTQNERWEEWLYDLHHRLLLEDTGLSIVGFTAMALIVLVLAGLFCFWPLRRGWRLGLLPRGASQPQLRASHRNLGVVVALPLLLTLSTAVLLAFPEQADELLVQPLRDQAYSDSYLEGIDDIEGRASGEWVPAFERALAVFPGGEIRSAQVPNAFNPYRIIGVKQAGEWHPNGLSLVYIDADLGYMDMRRDATGLPVVERAVNAGYPLHTGRTGSLLYKLLLTVSGLLIATLSLLGFYSFVFGGRARPGQ